MTHMEDDSLKDHAKTISIPTDREELGSDNSDQELTLTLLGSDEDILDQVEAAIRRIEDGDYGRCENAVKQFPRTAWTPSHMPQTAYDVLCNRKNTTGPERIRSHKKRTFCHVSCVEDKSRIGGRQWG